MRETIYRLKATAPDRKSVERASNGDFRISEKHERAVQCFKRH
jgi:hypothetical protein